LAYLEWCMWLSIDIGELLILTFSKPVFCLRIDLLQNTKRATRRLDKGVRVWGKASMTWAGGKIGIGIAMVQVIGPEIIKLMTRGGRAISTSFKPNPC
jgi:hypothetical protein